MLPETIHRPVCGKTRGVRLHMDRGETLCMFCRMCTLEFEGMTVKPQASILPPVTRRQGAANFAALADALGYVNDYEQVAS